MRVAGALLVAISLLCALVSPAQGAPGQTQAVGESRAVAPAEATAEEQPAEDSEGWVEKWSGLLPKILLALGVLGTAALVVIGLAMLAFVALRRLVRPSLTIKPFVDGGVETKVGSAVAALVEGRLIDLRKKGQRSGDAVQLDLVVADVELLGRDQNLANAVGGLAEVPHLRFVVAILGFVERLVGRRSLVAEGELIPSGAKGHGLVLSLYRRSELWARDVHYWAREPAPAPPWVPPAESTPGAADDPEPYYRLAAPASSWVQFETARSLHTHIALMTENAESFRLLAKGLRRQRAGRVRAAARAYSEALVIDPDNVAALVNLALLLARYERAYDDALALLGYARVVLERCHRELDR